MASPPSAGVCVQGDAIGRTAWQARVPVRDGARFSVRTRYVEQLRGYRAPCIGLVDWSTRGHPMTLAGWKYADWTRQSSRTVRGPSSVACHPVDTCCKLALHRACCPSCSRLPQASRGGGSINISNAPRGGTALRPAGGVETPHSRLCRARACLPSPPSLQMLAHVAADPCVPRTLRL